MTCVPVLALHLGLLVLTAAAADWTAVRLDPPEIHLAGPGASQRFIISGVSPTGDEWDLTPQCQVRSDHSDVAAVQSASIVAKSSGEAKIVVTCGGASGAATVRVGRGSAAPEVNFSPDIMSILTVKSCNSSSCHGSPAGQNGFKLSLYGSDPEADFRMIVQEHGGRRVNIDKPETSLLLRKPSFQTPHGGGQLTTPQSDEFQMLLKWLRQGAKFTSSGVRLAKLEIYPRERILAGFGSRQPIVVIGRLSDGTTRDMSAEVRYAVNDEAVVSAVREGAVNSKARGLTIVTARALGRTATAQMIVVERRADSSYSKLAPANFVDESVFAKLRRVNLPPFRVSSDPVFVRRVFLDLIGVLPTPEETAAFVRDPKPDKRARLIDQLLEREEYSTHWLTKFEDWFRNSQYYSQGRTNGSFKRWIRDLIRDDRPYDEAVREMLTATGDTTVRPAGNFWHPAIDFMLKTFEVSKAVPTVTRLFLGQRVECAECHNHPLENLTQDDFYGLAAFFGRLKVKHGYGQYRRVWYTTREGEVLHPATKKPVAPRLPDGTVPSIPEDVDRRQVLADWITRTQRLQFARAAVNRIWAEYFGVGIVEPADDFRSTNMPTHPDLLDRLATHFIDSGYRFKTVHRLILNSKTYQLSAHTADRPGGADPLERLLFARYEPRKLPAEVLLDAIVQVTGVPHKFNGYPDGTSPKNLIASIGGPYFLRTFGVPQRDVMERRSGEPSLSQALHLMNSGTLREKIEQPDNILGALLEREPEDRKVLEALYLRAYSRAPAESQWSTLESYLAAERDAGRSRRRAFENVLWAIMNSKEFQLNQ